jgi:cytochrome c biogenesis protein CcdA/thiol-disulfide isomerase/thioredoxin
MHPSIFLNLFLAFVEGFALIVSPCILPILPIMLSGSIEGGRYRPYGIILGFILVFSCFTLGSRLLVESLHLDLSGIRYLAFILIACFGLILASSFLSTKFAAWTQKLAHLGLRLSDSAVNSKSSGWLSGIVLGGLVSLIWVPCGGPILAAAIVQSAIQESNWGSFLSFLFFAFGSVLPMILIALLGRKLLQSLHFFKQYSESLRKVFGLIIFLGAGFAAAIDAGWLNLNFTSASTPAPTHESMQLIDSLKYPYPAPPLATSPSDWLNSPPLTLNALKGQVVLIDFWTYSCINCIRTLPYLKKWYAEYHHQGFEIIGVHTPEFQFEKDPNNVKAAIKAQGILYPVVMDNHYATWLNYNNQYWPAHYLIDRQGNVVAVQFGEGGYAETEHNIRVLLGLKSPKNLPTDNASPTFFPGQTPETYLGTARSGEHASVWSTQGEWLNTPQYIQNNTAQSKITLRFSAKQVFMVAHSATGPMPVTVSLNGRSMPGITLDAASLYPILNLDQFSSGVLQLTFPHPGAQLYTFTFGSN